MTLITTASHRAARRASLEEYFALEAGSPLKHEYYDGEIFVMTGATSNHNIIIFNLAAEMRPALRAKRNRGYVSEMRVVCPTGLSTYPDAIAVRGRPEIEKQNGLETLLNPTLLIEVLSPSTERYDRGAKFQHYQTIPSLTHYMLVAQNKSCVECFVRQPESKWLLTTVTGINNHVTVPELELTLSLAEVYADIEFPPPAAETDDPEHTSPTEPHPPGPKQ